MWVIFVGLFFSWWEPGATCGLTKQSMDVGRAFLLFYCAKPAVLGSPLGGGSPECRGLAFPPCGPVWLRLEAPCQSHPGTGTRRECVEAPGWGRSGSRLCHTGHPWRGRPHSPTLGLRAALMEKGPVTETKGQDSGAGGARRSPVLAPWTRGPLLFTSLFSLSPWSPQNSAWLAAAAEGVRCRGRWRDTPSRAPAHPVPSRACPWAEAHNAALCSPWLGAHTACLGQPWWPVVPALEARDARLGRGMCSAQPSRALGQALSRKHLGWPGTPGERTTFRPGHQCPHWKGLQGTLAPPASCQLSPLLAFPTQPPSYR